MPATPPTPLAATSPAVLRAAVVAVLVLTLVAAGLQAIGAVAAMDRADVAGPVPPLFAPAAFTVLVGVGLAALVEGAARVVGRAGPASADGMANPAAAATDRLAAAVADLRATLPALVAASRPAPAGAAADPAASIAVDPPPGDPYLAYFERLVQLLEEIKELTLLDDAQRQARGQQALGRRKAVRLEEAALFLHRRDWGQADALLTLLESLYPGDADVLARRMELDDARTAARDAAWAQLHPHAQDLMALSRYDEAAAAFAAIRADHPAHADAATLAAQVSAEREAYTDRSVAALFGEVKTAVDARQWRMALDGAQRLLGRFPDHPRADRVRQQVRVIQGNAEQEERREQEERIRDLARGGRYAEAADLCQLVIGRFPGSPQAAGLEQLLPKLRERSGTAGAAAE